jgi:hypothetical protein
MWGKKMDPKKDVGGSGDREAERVSIRMVPNQGSWMGKMSALLFCKSAWVMSLQLRMLTDRREIGSLVITYGSDAGHGIGENVAFLV